MRLQSPLAVFLCVATSLVLSGCGGGGGSSKSVVTPETYPASGAYGWVLKASGSTTALKYGLSLIHPSQPDAEFVIETASDHVSDALLVSRGSVNAGTLQVSSVSAEFLLYIHGGDVFLIPMQANGQSPASRRIAAGSTSACTFVRELAANDYASPQDSRFVVTTAGADGICGSADDGRAELRKDASVGLVLRPISAGAEPLAIVRDPATLAPRGWLYSRTVGLWNGASSTPFTVRSNAQPTQPALLSVVGSTYRQALVSDGTQLSVIDFSGGTGYTETPLDAGITAGNRWKLIGFDADAFYVHESSDFTSPWRVLKVARSGSSVSQMAAGTGVITLSSMGNNWLYLTVFDTACSGDALCSYLVTLKKSAVGETPGNGPGAPNTLISVEAGANGVNLLSFLPLVETDTSKATIGFFNDDDLQSTLAAPLDNIQSGYSMGLAEAASLNFNSSESRTRFVYATGYTVATHFNGATLNALETSGASYVPVLLGALPGSPSYGTDPSEAYVIAGPAVFGSAYVARAPNADPQASGSKVYSYDLGMANSLSAKTRLVN